MWLLHSASCSLFLIVSLGVNLKALSKVKRCFFSTMSTRWLISQSPVIFSELSSAKFSKFYKRWASAQHVSRFCWLHILYFNKQQLQTFVHALLNCFVKFKWKLYEKRIPIDYISISWIKNRNPNFILFSFLFLDTV